MNAKGILFLINLVICVGGIVAGLLLINLYDDEASKVVIGTVVLVVSDLLTWLLFMWTASRAVADDHVRAKLSPKELDQTDSLSYRIRIVYPMELFTTLAFLELALVMIPRTHNYSSSIPGYAVLGGLALSSLWWLFSNWSSDLKRINEIRDNYFALKSSVRMK